MRDPRDLYSFASADVVAAVPRSRMTLVHALPGLVDAGNACRIAATYLRDTLRHVRLVTFEADELVDYRGSRPQAVFDGRSYASVDIPQMAIYLMYDDADRPFLLLDGPEPDLQWQRLAQALIDLVEFFEVDQVVSMEAYPMAVPHTRPIALIAHANDGSLAPEEAEQQEETEVVVPASFGALLEKELERAGHRALGYAAQIPHYLTRTDFPAGALALLRRVSDATGLELPLVELGDLTDAAAAALSGTLAQNEEVGAIVTALEEQYDAAAADGALHGIATTMDLPTADEIGDHFERFLARQDDQGPRDGEGPAPV
ncbi:proteasome assembly chaperone family protein [Brachybacterium hainanense]|uniref:Proteasome assembly chaperone family protein n=1 Tax=Brachybacterium hainanense TaxID=1541174 RepID=A0ABV6RET0_9MICO